MPFFPILILVQNYLRLAAADFKSLRSNFGVVGSA